MTVISTLITRHCTVHSTDSLISEIKDGNYCPMEWEKSKIIPIVRFRGAMSYWGLAKCDKFRWSTYEWLSKQVQDSNCFTSAEELAYNISDKLNLALSTMRFSKPEHYGIGIHFTAYERIDDYQIPELFLISNFADTNYTSLRGEGVGVSRETFHVISEYPPLAEHRDKPYRLAVHNFLNDKDGMFIYNNGDPILFNPLSNAIHQCFNTLYQRKQLKNDTKIATHMALARRPIEMISKAQADFCLEGKQLVGGKPHDLAITPNGSYESTTGDKP
jgi:hypothetical protein